MKKLLSVLGLLLCLTPVASAAVGGPKKPTICTEYTVLHAPHRVVALCTDGKKPRVLVRFVTVEVPVAENDTDVRMVAVGYTSVDE